MILVTVGTEHYPFNRLMNWIKVLQQHQLIQEEVIVQYGSCTNLPTKANHYQTLKADQFAELVQAARLVISHCGEGSLLLLEELEKPYILVPRSYKFKEHVDNHQVEMAIALAETGRAIAWSLGDVVRFLNAPAVPVALSSTTATALCEKLNNLCLSIQPSLQSCT